MKRLLRVVAPHFVAGAIWEKHDDTWQCVYAAPILWWMVNRPSAEVVAILRRKRYEWEWI
ncbi:hypothetical protein [Burkholderia sp. LMG 21824]|uniref:hypothetical protein n=1 Tax=Burkholderia sp. LMG 21824 TaxID=3158172 RepID=UPI003C30CA72